MLAPRVWAHAILGVLIIEALMLPWTAHLFDAVSLILHADGFFFGHVPPTDRWPYGSVILAALLISQFPVLLFPSLAGVTPLRIVLLKSTAWIADLGTAAIIRTVADAETANFWALRYLIDPSVVFVTVFHGQLDAIPNLFAVAGIALTLTQRYEIAALAFGLGAGAKFYPAAFVPLLFVVTAKHRGVGGAAKVFAVFAVTAAVTLLPVEWGRLESWFGFYKLNSFGPAGADVAPTSLWFLVPSGVLRPQIEQLIAVVIPILVAAAEWRHQSNRVDIARAAMLIAISVVLLNPGVHQPFYLWIVGPLVLYAAVAGDGIVSSAGAILSLLGILIQFCQEGSDEYFIMNFGAGPSHSLMRCYASPTLLEWLALLCVLTIVVASYRRSWLQSANAVMCPVSASIAVALFVLFVVSFGQSVASASGEHAGLARYHRLVKAMIPVVIAPVKRRSGESCVATYDARDYASFAGNPFAAQYVSASLGYTLFNAEDVVVNGRKIRLAEPPSSYEDVDFRTIGEDTMRVTQEFDVTELFRPFAGVQTLVELPCTEESNNPVLIYRFDLEAAYAAAVRRPLLERLNLLSTGG